MIVAPVAQALASALVLTVAGSCARNMMQTAGVRKQHQHQQQLAFPDTCPAGTTTTTTIDNPLASLLLVECGTTSLSDCLKNMNRKELLQVFANGRAPTEVELQKWFSSSSSNNNNNDNNSDNNSSSHEKYCEWDAMLLDNDGIIMNASPNFFTHQLFGGKLLPWRLLGEASERKGRWNGKAFGKPTKSCPTGGTGINRFSSSKTNSNFLRHTFDYGVTRSQVLQGGEALRLDYWRYQSLPVSLWWSMHDELRVIEFPQSSSSDDDNDGDDGDKIVLLGMGWMGWSGGALNCSPFLLERSR